MKIVRTFNAIALLHQPNQGVLLHNEYLVAKETGFVMTPAIYPRLAWRYLGFQAHPENGITVALYEESNFFHWDGTHWISTPEAVYQSPEEIREGIEFWMGAVQLYLRIEQGKSLKEVVIGYEVNLDPIEYIFNFAVPHWLQKPYRLNRIVQVKADGTLDIPKGYNAEQFLELQVRPLEGLPLNAKVQGSVIRPESSLSPQPVQLLFTVQPQVEFTEGIYQIEQAPCVVLRELDIRQYHAPYRYEPVLTNTGRSELDFSVANFDLPVEVSVMATERADAQAIANQIMHKVRDEGRLYIPPIDLDLGCYVEGGIGAGGGQEAVPLELDGGMGVATPSNIRGGLPTVVFRLIFKNLAN